MSQSTKAAWLAFSFTIVLTAIKFILYWLSGSIAVLSEAWHSTSDVATTMLVLVSIIHQSNKTKTNSAAATESHSGLSTADTSAAAEHHPTNAFVRAWRWFRRVNTELKISTLIGGVLMIAAATIFWRGIVSERAVVSLPLITGLIFIGLSFGSFFISRFEALVGQSEDSAALVADSHHNRADMAISLLTGISLILYYFTIDVDRWVGIFIALYIFTFASELLVNSIRAIVTGNSRIAFEYRFTSIIWRAFQVETYISLARFIDTQIQISSRAKAFLKKIPLIFRWVFRLTAGTAAAAALLAYLSTFFYTVAPNEKALLMRMGRLVNETADIGPGIHLKLPYPVDRVTTFDATSVQNLVLGNSMVAETAMIWTKDHGDNQAFISGDNNLFLPYIVVHYRINSVHDYYLSFSDGVPEKMLTSLSLQMLNQLFSTTPFYDLILTEREPWTREFAEQLQARSDELKIGIEIVEFCLRDLHPPIELAGSYEEVVAANQLKKANLNDAERRVDALLSRERIKKMKTVAEARSYVIEKEKIAEGEATNYLLRYQGYMEGGAVMKDILLLKAAETALTDKKIFLVDPKSGIDGKLIYLENYMSGRKN